MEKYQDKNQKFGRDLKSYKRQGLVMGVLTGILMIAAGIIVVMHNLGSVSDYAYGVVISWPMLLIVSGLLCVLSRNYGTAIVFVGIGLFCMIPKVLDAGTEWMSVYWPLILIFAGVLLIVKLFMPGKKWHRKYAGSANHRTENGFVHIDSSMGGYEHIVLDEVFRGGSITGTLSGTVLDLRHTTIPEGDTFIDIQGTLCGIEIYAPAGWEIISQVRCVLGGVDDKRRGRINDAIPGRKIVLCGNMTLGGIEIKS